MSNFASQRWVKMRLVQTHLFPGARIEIRKCSISKPVTHRSSIYSNSRCSLLPLTLSQRKIRLKKIYANTLLDRRLWVLRVFFLKKRPQHVTVSDTSRLALDTLIRLIRSIRTFSFSEWLTVLIVLTFS